MFKPSLCYIAILLCAIAVGHIQAQEAATEEQDEMRVVERDSLALTIPNPFGDTPFLEINDQHGPYLGINIPLIWDFAFHWRDGGGLGNMMLDQNFLSGLWHYTYDKTDNPSTGDLQGPTKLSVLGLSLWDNEEAPVNQQATIEATPGSPDAALYPAQDA